MFQAIYSDVFEIFWNICLKIYELILANFLSAPGLAWQGALKKTKVKLDLSSYIARLLEEEYVTQFIKMQKLITNTWKVIIKMKNRHIFNIGI